MVSERRYSCLKATPGAVGRFVRDMAKITLQPKWKTDTNKAIRVKGGPQEVKVVKPSEDELSKLVPDPKFDGWVNFYANQGDAYPCLIQDVNGKFFERDAQTGAWIEPSGDDEKSKAYYVLNRDENIDACVVGDGNLKKVVRWEMRHHYLGNLPVVMVYAGIVTSIGFIAKKLHSKFAKNMLVEDLGDEDADEDLGVVEETA